MHLKFKYLFGSYQLRAFQNGQIVPRANAKLGVRALGGFGYWGEAPASYGDVTKKRIPPPCGYFAP
jgi:hypothetical protein